MGNDGGGGTDSPDGVASTQIVGASASAIFPCTIKSSTAHILIHSQLKALAVNLSQPFGQLWFYAGLNVSNDPRWLKAP